MTVLLRRHAKLETIKVQRATGADDQGLPTYSDPISIQAFVKAKETKIDRLTTASAVDEVQIQTAVWVDYHQPVLPDYNDRLTLADGTTGIVVDRIVARKLRKSHIDHVRLGLREE